MGRVRFSTPYYLAGKQKQRFHNEHARRGAAAAAIGGAAAAGFAHPKIGHELSLIASRKVGTPVDPKVGMAVFGAGAALGTGYAGYHAVRAHNYKKNFGKRAGGPKSSYYTRKVKGKTQRVKKGR